MTQRLPAADVVRVLNRFFTMVVDAASAEGGFVNKFEGDAALCVFGAPTELDDHAGACLRAAARLRDELDGLVLEHADLDAGIGVSTGDVVAGNVGAEDRYEFTVIGDAVNEAARLCELAKRHPSRVLASGACIELASIRGDSWRHDHDVVLRGREGETAVYVPDRS
jgi:adenylate cyclase